MAEPVPFNPYSVPITPMTRIVAGRRLNVSRMPQRRTAGSTRLDLPNMGLIAQLLAPFLVAFLVLPAYLSSVRSSQEARRGAQATAAENNPFTIQVGAFRDLPSAKRHAARVTEKSGLAPEIRRERGWYLLVIGRFPSRKAAEIQVEKLKSFGIQTWVRTALAEKES